ncbi:MAG: hypothetical protein ACLQDF_08635 [Desulfomonilia bacterium]
MSKAEARRGSAAGRWAATTLKGKRQRKHVFPTSDVFFINPGTPY